LPAKIRNQNNSDKEKGILETKSDPKAEIIVSRAPVQEFKVWMNG
jgi:hypothetical protein